MTAHTTSTRHSDTANEKFDFLVFIGRFQPFHLGHAAVVDTALERSDKLIMLLGSSHQPRSLRNPWTFAERDSIIRASYSEQHNHKIITAPLMDVMYNDELWVKNIQETVHGLVTAHFAEPHRKPRIGLIGHNKDHTSYYLNLFPQWGSVAVDNLEILDATNIRKELLSQPEELSKTHQRLVTENIMSQAAADALLALCEKDDGYVYHELCDEYAFITKYKSAWDAAPYAPTFVTVDGVVVQSGHVLLVERKANPGKGLFALPGGFLDQDERLETACIRELKEETKIKVPEPVLRGSIKAHEVFDDPHRSARGRTITHAFYIELKADKKLPKVVGSDDAKQAIWMPLADLNPEEMFEDHYFIIRKMLGES